MADMSKPNMKQLEDLATKAFSFTQAEVYANRQSWKGHSTAVVFSFPEGIGKLNLTTADGGLPERIVRLAESLNRPESMKADFWTKTPNGGVVPGIVPGVDVGGEPMPVKAFFSGMQYTMLVEVSGG